MTESDAHALERCLADGGIAVFPADTVYGLACDPDDRAAVERLYALKDRPLEKPSAVMFFNVAAARAALPTLGDRSREAMLRLLPGGVTLLLPNPHGLFPLACGEDPQTLGVRVPDVPALASVGVPVLQSSANLAGGAEARRLADVPEQLLRAADLVIDGGELPGTASTVIDLRRYEQDGTWTVLREGAVSAEALKDVLVWQFHFEPATYIEMIRTDIPVYERLQEELVRASGSGARRILELGTGTGETARRLLARHGGATLHGIDVSPQMLAAAREQLPAERVTLAVGRIEDPLPSGPFDLVASALCVHHLDGAQKAELFRRIRTALAPGGRFVLADVVVPEAPADATTSLTPGYDQPSTLADQLRWMRAAALEPTVIWEHGDLAVVTAERGR